MNQGPAQVPTTIGSGQTIQPSGNIAGGTINYSILFVKKFPHYINQEKLQEICSRYGEVIKVQQKKITTAAGIEKFVSQATVTFANKDAATNASKKLYMDNEVNPNAQLVVDFFQNRVARMVEKDNQNSFMN